ncbi:hypothetical protein JCM10207_003746 [Rhodosporidiobolus poonsookiae]
MAIGVSTVFYGAFVKSLSLLAAARAWPSLEPTLLAIDLISLRRTTGKLEVETGASTSVTTIPVELWSKIKLALVDVELESAYDWISRNELWCRRCSSPPAIGPDEFELDCGRCIDRLSDRGNLWGMIAGHEKDLTALLGPHGLHHPIGRTYTGKIPAYDDVDSLYAIALRQPSTDHMTSTFEACQHEDEVGHAVFPVDPSFFTLPRNAASRFRAFCRLFRLPLYDPNRHRSKPPPPPHANMRVDGPSWHFWSFVEDGHL